MAKFDVYLTGDGRYLLDCQADVLSGLNSRFVVPLDDSDPGSVRRTKADDRLNPTFLVDGKERTMLTHLAAAVSSGLLGTPVQRLEDHEYRIGAALDRLISGF